MNKLIGSTLIAGILGISSILAQEEQKTDVLHLKKHEINIGFTNLFSPNRTNYEPYYPFYSALASQGLSTVPIDYLYYPYPVNPGYDRTQFGIGYKFHFGRNAARLMMSFMASNEESDNMPQNGYEFDNSNNYNVFTARTGIEHTFVRLKKLDFYLALDGIYKSSETKNESSSYYNITGERYASSNSQTYTAFGAGLGLGLRFYVHENLSFSTETHIDYISETYESKNESSSTGMNAYSDSSTNKTIGSKTMVNPFAVLSVNVHF